MSRDLRAALHGHPDGGRLPAGVRAADRTQGRASVEGGGRWLTRLSASTSSSTSSPRRYHDIRPEKGVYYRLALNDQVDRITYDETIECGADLCSSRRSASRRDADGALDVGRRDSGTRRASGPRPRRPGGKRHRPPRPTARRDAGADERVPLGRGRGRALDREPRATGRCGALTGWRRFQWRSSEKRERRFGMLDPSW